MFKPILKRTLSCVLALTLVVTMFSVVAPSGLFTTAQAALTKSNPSYDDDLFFIVPEAIYLTPVNNSGVAATSSAFQYYVDQSFNGTTISNRTGEQTSGNLYFYYPNAVGDVSISFRWQEKPGVNLDSSAQITLSDGASTTFSPGGSFLMLSGTSPVLITGGTSPSLAASDSGVYIEWKATFTDSVDGQTKTAYAYTYVYKPYVYPIGVAQDSRNSCGTNHYADSLSWISGVHGTQAPRDRYPTVNTENGFLPFSSGDQITAQLPAYFKSEGLNNVSSEAWVSGDQSSAPDASCTYFESTKDSSLQGDNEVLNFAYSATGFLTVDTSRYQNLSQIPNLSIGMLVTNDELSSAGAAYFVSNVTGSKHNADYTGYWNTSDDTADGYWNDYYNGDRIYSTGSFPDDLYGNEKEGVKFDVKWNKSVPSVSGLQYLGTGFANHNSNDMIVNIAELRCRINVYNKGELREAYQNAMKSFAKNNAELLKSSSWGSFIALYRAAAQELCKVDGMFETVTVNGTQYTSASALAAALNNMTWTCAEFNASVRETYTATQIILPVYESDGVWTLSADAEEQTVSGYFKGAAVHFVPDTIVGYTYAGYRTEPEGKTSAGSETYGQPKNVTAGNYNVDHADGDLQAFLYYVCDNYTITFDANGGNSVSGMTYNIGSSATLPAATRNGYSFAGWIPYASSGTWNSATVYAAGTSLSGKSGDVTLVAQWVSQAYTITFDANGGDSVDSMSYSTTDSTSLPSATRTAYTFDGWMVTLNTGNWTVGQVCSAGTPVNGKFGDVTMSAQWTPIEYTITFDVNGGESFNNRTYTIELFDVLGAPTRGGFTFDGWKVTTPAGNWDAGTYDADQLLIGKYGNVTMQAQWSSSSYTITFDTQGGTEVASISYDLTSQIVLPTSERAAYMFNGWIPQTPSGSWQDTIYSAGIPMNDMFGDVTLNALWSARGYAITFDTRGGDPVDDMNYNVILSFELPVPTREGYLFDGWTPRTDTGNWLQSETYAAGNMIQGMYGNVTLCANWKAAAHTHTYSAYITYPTCTEDGYTKYVCDYCGDWYMDNYVSATGHEPGETVTENFVSRSCTQDGGYDNVVYCINCREELSRERVVFPARGHTPGDPVSENMVDPTCAQDGSCDEVVYCMVCGEELQREYIFIPRFEHTPGNSVRENEVPATCLENGSYSLVVYCTECGAELSRNNYTTPKTSHTPGDPIIMNEIEPTCTDDRRHDEYVYCTVCGELISYNSVVDYGSALGHDFASASWTPDPENNLQHMRSCQRCGLETEYGAHNFDVYVTQPSCTSAGYVYYTCADCGYGYSELGDAALGHTFTEWECDDEENHFRYCERCEKEIQFAAHEMYETSRTEATCAKEGSATYTCEVCGYSYDVTLQKLQHIPGSQEIENEVPATCSATGSFDKVVRCTVCGEEISRETVTSPKTAHTPGEAKVENVVDPTCTSEGSYDEVVYCTVCGAEISRAGKNSDRIDHTPGDPVHENEVPATCSATGSFDEVVRCTVCGEEISRETVTSPKTAHTLGETKVENVVDPTCTSEGSYDEVVYCTVCGTELSRETQIIPATGHTHTPLAAVRENEVQPTCTEDGSYDEVVYCSECGEEISRDTITIPATGHEYDTQVTEPTCLSQGYTTYTCRHDPSHTYTDDFVPALGHEWGEWVVIKEPTAAEAGQKTRTCSRCGTTETGVIEPLIESGTLALSSATAHPGETVKITVSIRNNPGIISALLKIGYDSSVLTLIDVEDSGLLSGAEFYAGNDLSANPYTAFWVNSLAQSDYTDNGALATLTFRVAQDVPAGSTQVTITYSMGSTLNRELRQIPFILENGAVEVSDRMPGDANNDGEITALDIVLIERFLAGGWNVTIDERNADVDGDNDVTLRDVTLIARYLVGGWGVELI